MDAILAILALVLAGFFIVYVVLPVSFTVLGVLLLLSLLTALGASLVFSVRNYVSAIRHNLNFHSWTWEKDEEPARRSYFFGPGYAQLAGTIREAFSLIGGSLDKVRDLSDIIRGFSPYTVLNVLRSAAAFIVRTAGSALLFVFSALLCGLLALVHGSVTTAVMLATDLVCGIVWLCDTLYLRLHRIHSDCPGCHRRVLVPAFRCPACGAVHKKLLPGPYGIWHHTCQCGQVLPSSFMSGRSRLDALCPVCMSDILASDARPIVFQLVGGSNAGKTAFLASFFHEYRQELDAVPALSTTIPAEYQPFFDDLEHWFRDGICPATAERNARMYPLLLQSPQDVPRQLSVLDVAGELFDGSSGTEPLQQQFRYCDGLLFLLDPFSSGSLRRSRSAAGDDLSGFSSMPAEDAAAGFINYLLRTGHADPSARCSIPLAVLIAKADLPEVKRRIGPAKISSIFRKAPDRYTSIQQARDELCRDFLCSIGLAGAVGELEAQFSRLHYFPISAMGHAPDGTPFEPWGIMEPIRWLLPLADSALSERIDPRHRT